MTAKSASTRELLETLALQHAAGQSVPGARHGSRIAKIAVKSWQADMLRSGEGITVAETPAALRDAMASPETVTIFLPHTAMVTHEIIERICSESSLSKMVIWEED